MRSVHPEIGQTLLSEKALTDQITAALNAALQEYKQTADFSQG
jgi:hypothetical protein